MDSVKIKELKDLWFITVDPANVGRQEAWFDGIASQARPAPVPGQIQQVFSEYHGVAWYWRNFKLDNPVGQTQTCLLRFASVDYYAEVWCNGKLAGKHEGGETPFTVDVTESIIHDGDNLLAVRVLNPSREMIDGMCMNETPHLLKRPLDEWNSGCLYNSGGITGNVRLEIVPQIRITDVYACPDVETGKISVEVTVHNDCKDSVDGKVVLNAGSALDGNVLDSVEIEAGFVSGDSLHKMTLTIENVHLWDIDDPYLYRVDVALNTENAVSHSHSVKCGFRDFRVEKGFFRLNGRRIFLKSTHTINHFPVGQFVPPTPDLLRRDLIMAKAAGYNTVRFIANMAISEQLDFCDEIGLMVYEENRASWQLADSPNMARRFDDNLREMIIRDRNHPSVVIWGLLNETFDDPTFRHAVSTLPLLRSLDTARLVLLGSGRFDNDPTIGSVCNPGSLEWEYQWGNESADATPQSCPTSQYHAGYVQGMGDAHVYPKVPHPQITNDFMRTLGKGTNPVFLSEYGIGSLFNTIREARKYEEHGAVEHLPELKRIHTMVKKFESDWTAFGLDGTYSFPEDMLVESQRLSIRQRSMTFDLVRSNPDCCGYNLTGMLDQGLTGEGVWTFWREWKPGSCEALNDGWAPLRWCLFADTLHGYSGHKFKFEAVLANEDVLEPGVYPVRLRISGPEGIVWEKKIDFEIAQPDEGKELPLAIQCFCDEIVINGPSGEYEFAACMERGGAPAGGRLKFYVSNLKDQIKDDYSVLTWGIDSETCDWLSRHNVSCKPFSVDALNTPCVVLVGRSSEMKYDVNNWRRLVEHISRGGAAIFLNHKAFEKGSFKPVVGKLEKSGPYRCNIRDFEVENMPQNEWPVFSKEFYCDITYLASELPDDEYTIELGMSQVLIGDCSSRIFNVDINGRRVLDKFDIIKETGNKRLAVIRTFTAKPDDGKIKIDLTSEPLNAATISRLRIYDSNKQLIMEDSAYAAMGSELFWLPLEKKGCCTQFDDWLYHKDCVAKLHPIFKGMQKGKGVMDWDYYGPVIPKIIMEAMEPSEDVAAVSFAVGYPVTDGYSSGVLNASYSLGNGVFMVNTLNIIDNVCSHPAAGKLLLNMIKYVDSKVSDEIKPLPKDFDQMLRKIGYEN